MEGKNYQTQGKYMIKEREREKELRGNNGISDRGLKKDEQERKL